MMQGGLLPDTPLLLKSVGVNGEAATMAMTTVNEFYRTSLTEQPCEEVASTMVKRVPHVSNRPREDAVYVQTSLGWRVVTAVIRHPVSFKMLLDVHTAECGVVSVTQDHIMMLHDGSSRSPLELRPDQQLLTMPPQLEWPPPKAGAEAGSEERQKEIDRMRFFGHFFACGSAYVRVENARGRHASKSGKYMRRTWRLRTKSAERMAEIRELIPKVYPRVCVGEPVVISGVQQLQANFGKLTADDLVRPHGSRRLAQAERQMARHGHRLMPGRLIKTFCVQPFRPDAAEDAPAARTSYGDGGHLRKVPDEVFAVDAELQREFMSTAGLLPDEQGVVTLSRASVLEAQSALMLLRCYEQRVNPQAPRHVVVQRTSWTESAIKISSGTWHFTLRAEQAPSAHVTDVEVLTKHLACRDRTVFNLSVRLEPGDDVGTAPQFAAGVGTVVVSERSPSTTNYLGGSSSCGTCGNSSSSSSSSGTGDSSSRTATVASPPMKRARTTS